MTAITPRAIIVDGVRLDNYAFAITSRNGWDNTPGLIGENNRVPGRDGEVWRAKDYGIGRLVLDLYIAGSNTDGAVPVGSTADRTFRNNLDSLLAIFGKRASLITVDKEMEDGSVRRNFGEVGVVLTPDYFFGEPFALMRVEITFPDPLWRATTTTNQTISITGSALSLTSFAGITAPITDATLTVTGAVTNPRITDNATGAWIQYTGTVAGGSSWVVNCANFTSTVGGTSVITNTTFNPGPRFFTVSPSTNLTPSLTVTGGGTLTVAAARRFLS